MVKIAVIGTAGRQGVKLTSENYDKMYDRLKQYLSQYDKNSIELISGGAAWSDHLAIRAYLDNIVYKLSLYLPCTWDYENDKYHENINDGKMSNIYHNNFSKETKMNSFDQIAQAILSGAYVDESSKGCLDRNNKVAQNCDKMIAFTMSETDSPAKGGTQYTWNKAINKEKLHISIPTL